MALDIASNRSARKYGTAELARRVLWMVGAVVFRFVPRPFFGIRNSILRLFGAHVGRDVRFYGSVVVYMPWNLTIGDWSAVGEHAVIYNLGPVTIGRSATISQRAHLCAGTHAYTAPDMPLLKPPIVVGDQVWICADAFVGPGVRVGEGAVVGACAVAMRDVPAWTVVAGNPARTVKRRELIRA